MADKTKIEWTDATWNPITGCSVVSPGCTNCYAMRLAGTRLKHHPTREGLTVESKAGPVWNGQVRLNEKALLEPLRWKRPRMIFVCAHGDLFAENVPDDWIDQVFAVMALAPQHTFQVLTKRPERMRAYLTNSESYGAILLAADPIRAKWPKLGSVPISSPSRMTHWPHVWLGVSVEDQKRADERIPILLDTPAATRFISAEPLLAGLRLKKLQVSYVDAVANALSGIWTWGNGQIAKAGPSLDWVIAGGESGPGARPMHPDWARSLRDQCASAGIPFFFKQWGNWRKWDDVAAGFKNCSRFDRLGNVTEARARLYGPYKNGFEQPEGDFPWHGEFLRFDKKIAGRLLDGIEHNAMPGR